MVMAKISMTKSVLGLLLVPAFLASPSSEAAVRYVCTEALAEPSAEVRFKGELAAPDGRKVPVQIDVVKDEGQELRSTGLVAEGTANAPVRRAFLHAGKWICKGTLCVAAAATFVGLVPMAGMLVSGPPTIGMWSWVPEWWFQATLASELATGAAAVAYLRIDSRGPAIVNAEIDRVLSEVSSALSATQASEPVTLTLVTEQGATWQVREHLERVGFRKVDSAATP